MKKRQISLLLALCLVLTLLPVSAAASDAIFTYRKVDGGLYVTGFSPDSNHFKGGIIYDKAYYGEYWNSPVIGVDHEAFKGYPEVDYIYLEPGITWVAQDAFTGCGLLKDIQVSPQNAVYEERDGVLYLKESQQVWLCPEGKSGAYTIPEGTVSIADFAFLHCNKLESVTIPASVKSIGVAAFGLCSGLKDVYYNGTKEQWREIEIADGNADPFSRDYDGVHYSTANNSALLDARIHFSDGTVQEPVAHFSDVPFKAYYYEPVAWAVEQNITKGTGDAVFSPDSTCTRGQIVTFLWRAAGSPQPQNSGTSFYDVSADSYFADAVNWAVEQNITSGTGNGAFSPDAGCTRSQVVTFLYRAAGSPDAPAESSFSDVPADAYYAAPVSWAVENGITSGTGGNQFSPELICTRAQIVTFLYRDAQNESGWVYLPLKETTISYDPDGNETTRETVYEYDRFGNNIRLTHDGFILEEAEYNALGEREKRTYLAEGEEKVTNYTYDANGNVLKETSKWNYSSVTEEISYSYDDSGRCVMSKWTGRYSDAVEYQYYTYDELGRQIEYTYTIAHDDGYTSSEKHSYAYDENGIMTKDVWTSSYGRDGDMHESSIVAVYTNSYDDQGNLLSCVEDYNGGSQIFKHEYVYNADGALVKTIYTDDNGGVSTTEYTYSDGFLVKSTFVNSNGYSGTITYEYVKFPVNKLPPHWQDPMEPMIYA